MNRVALMEVEQEIVEGLWVALERVEELELGENLFYKWLEGLGLEREQVRVRGVDVDGVELLRNVGGDQLVQACAGGLLLLPLGEMGLLLFLFGHCGAVLPLQLVVLDEQVQPAVLCDNTGVLFLDGVEK